MSTSASRVPIADRKTDFLPLLMVIGLFAFTLSALSIADMLVPRPYDGVVLDKTAASDLRVREVVPGSGADLAGIRAGDQIIGIGRAVLNDETQAAARILAHRIGEKVPYLIRSDGRTHEVVVELGRRTLGSGVYIYTCFLGFAFFFVGLFALVRRPRLFTSQIFFWLCCLFLVFLVCRVRPPSYSGFDAWILGFGVMALVLLAPAFLHFYVLFPRPAWLESLETERRLGAVVWLFQRGWLLLYVLPPLLLTLAWALSGARKGERWFGGVPHISWWLLGLCVLLGLLALGANGRRLDGARERRGVAWILAGSIFGLLPFVLGSLWLGELYETQAGLDRLIFGLGPLTLVPLTFVYAIVRFQLLDIRIILRRSLLYTSFTAILTATYAVAIAGFNAFFNRFFSTSELASSELVPVLLALAIVLLFDPIRKRLQDLIDRIFFAGRSQLQQAMEDLGEAMTARSDLQDAVRDLVERLPRLLGFRFAALYMHRGGRLERIAGPLDLPTRLPLLPDLQRYLGKRRGVRRLDQMGALSVRYPEVGLLVEQLTEHGVESIADMASRRRHIGLVLFSDRPGRSPLEDEEKVLLERLLGQAAIALETGLLLEERTQKAELEREMEIAATIQAQLLPQSLQLGPDWAVAARCLPARLVGGDFYAQVASGTGGDAVIYGDVSGKSVSGAMMMMAAHESLYTLSMAIESPEPSRLFELANRRLYGLGKRSFVALGYFAERDGGLEYLIAGQPPPLIRRRNGEAEELPLPQHRVPLGALPRGAYAPLQLDLEVGEIVLAYSDGVTDARAPDGTFFGEDRLVEVLHEAVEGVRRPDPEALVDAVLKAVKAFTRGGLLYDDVTLVAIAKRPPEQDENSSRGSSEG